MASKRHMLKDKVYTDSYPSDPHLPQGVSFSKFVQIFSFFGIHLVDILKCILFASFALVICESNTKKRFSEIYLSCV